jgi:hypothetical protein
MSILNDVPEHREPPQLFELIAQRARRASDGVLVLCAGAGVIGSCALFIALPAWWTYALPVVTLGAFGFWGIAERELSSTNRARNGSGYRLLRIAQMIAATVGAGAAIVSGLTVFRLIIGTWIS